MLFGSSPLHTDFWMTDSAWMVRSDGGALFEAFNKGRVAVGWPEVGDLRSANDRETVAKLIESTYTDYRTGQVTSAVTILHKIRSAILKGDRVVTYDPSSRKYLIGRVIGDYAFDSDLVGPAHPHTRAVAWEGSVLRDTLSASTRNTLGSTLTIFSINEDATAELFAAAKGDLSAPQSVVAVKEELASVREDESAKAMELVKDAIVAHQTETLNTSPPLSCGLWATALGLPPSGQCSGFPRRSRARGAAN